MGRLSIDGLYEPRRAVKMGARLRVWPEEARELALQHALLKDTVIINNFKLPV